MMALVFSLLGLAYNCRARHSADDPDIDRRPDTAKHCKGRSNERLALTSDSGPGWLLFGGRAGVHYMCVFFRAAHSLVLPGSVNANWAWAAKLTTAWLFGFAFFFPGHSRVELKMARKSRTLRSIPIPIPYFSCRYAKPRGPRATTSTVTCSQQQPR
ncbi:hypothetical protein F4861DRAFT_205827 [Xylaria intraflava]|nr:hypothetical protein F4861DRAFT_205827 [Xylaria intraflava]